MQIGNGLEGNHKPTSVAIIPDREYYPGLVRVPYREFHGSILLEWATQSASKPRVVTKVIVSSQSQRVLDLATDLEAQGKVPHHARILRDDSNTTQLPI